MSFFMACQYFLETLSQEYISFLESYFLVRVGKQHLTIAETAHGTLVFYDYPNGLINGSYLRSYFLMASESHVPEIVPFYSNAITQFIADSIDQWLYINSDIVLFKGFIKNNLHLGFP